ELMITLLNDNRSSGLSAAHAEPGVGKSIATALALQKCEKSAVSVLLQGEFTYSLEEFFRFAHEFDHHLIVITQSEEAANEVDDLNGERSAATQIKPVWVRQLEQDDEKFVQIGSSFKVQGELADVDDVKEAIAQKKPNTVSCDADEIDIYSQKEGGWVREDEEAAVNRGKSRADCYGFTLPGAAGVA
ncbi:unnamed protein product, partial [Effrenium voratum]